VAACRMAAGGVERTLPVYVVPWKVHTPKDSPAKGLVLYWFPASGTSGRIESARVAHASVYASQCVTMEVGTNQTRTP